MNPHRRLASLALPLLFVAGLGLATLAPAAEAAQAGMRSMTVPGAEPIPVVLFYPSSTPERALPMGPWTARVAPGGAPDQAIKGLIVISHGTGGSEIGHHELASALARAGYLVAALRHPRDNWEDRSLIVSGRYFTERPAQVSRVLDALLADPAWASRIPAGRIGVLGHSAGGFTVLSLAGGKSQLQRVVTHCGNPGEDTMFCDLGKMGGRQAPTPDAQALTQITAAADPRVRAVVALAPMAQVLTPESLAAVKVPTLIYVAEKDRVLIGRYHGLPAAQSIPGAQLRTAAGAGHFAFMSKPSMPLPSDAGDASEDPAGFDRNAFQARLAPEIVSWFDEKLR